MTRNKPQFPPVGGNQYEYGYEDTQQGRQYDGSQRTSNEDIAYNQGQVYNEHGQYPQQEQSQYNEPPPGYAQSYYATNEQAYQQYPGNQPNIRAHQEQYYGNMSPKYSYRSQSSHAEQSYSPPSAPMYGQDYNPSASGYPPSNSAVSSEPSSSDERGFAGALAGGAAGAYGGHKVHHGFLGMIGGAIAGSMIENAYKKHEKKNQTEAAAAAATANTSHIQAEQSAAPHYGPPQNLQGNFSASCYDLQLQGNSVLMAQCKDVHGQTHLSALDLNDCLTNTNGDLRWARGGNFANSSREIRLVEGGRMLEAVAGDGQGGWKHNRVWLDERITNNDGKLELIE